jgi:predicted transcriptional regulator of viral defense system
MNSGNLVERLKELALPVVSIDTISNIIQKPAGYTRSYASRLCKEGIIRRVERGLYCLQGTDDYTIASRIIPNSYITGYAALGHYGLTTQIAIVLQMVSPKYHRPVKLKDYTVKFSKVKRSFIYGYRLTLNGPAFAEPEKIFVDDLYLHGRQYYGEEFEEAVGRKRIDIKKLKDYSVRSGRGSVVALMGHYMEKQGLNADNLSPFKSKTYIKLGKSGQLDRKWKVYW